MVKIPSAEEISRRYKEGAGRAPSNYAAGINATTDWQAKASSDSAESNYSTGVQAAIASRKRQKAVSNVSDSEWKSKAGSLGATRIGPGMQANADKRTKNYEPIRSALASLSLPDKTTDPMTNIDQRLKKTVEAEIAASKARLGI
jgi:hypothetical protein